MTTYNMSDDIVWRPRTIRRVEVVTETTKVLAEANEAVKKIQRQWSHLVTALMRVLDDFQDAKAAVMAKFCDLEDVETIPEWGT